MKLYEYQPLSTGVQSRIIELEPSLDKSAPLQCVIRELDIYEHDSYDALSYTWGEATLAGPLFVRDSVIMLTANLLDALLRFRLPYKSRRIWADAICINQQDGSDKDRQIPFMSDIYRSAASVLVWLGHHNDESACLKELLAYSRVKEMGWSNSESLSELLKTFITLPWFGRRWIIQEAVLNPDTLLCYGDDEITLTRLFHLLVQVKELPEAKSLLAMYDLWKTWVLQTKPDSDCKILRLLVDFDDFQCKDDRDRIYSVAGLATDIELILDPEEAFILPEEISTYPRMMPGDTKCMQLRVDYGISTEHLYENLAVSAMTDGTMETQLELLGQVVARRCGQAHRADLASWVPDWRLPMIRKPFLRPKLVSGGDEVDQFLRLSCTTTSTTLNILAQSYALPYCTVSSKGEVFPTTLDRHSLEHWLYGAYPYLVARGWDPKSINANSQFLTACLEGGWAIRRRICLLQVKRITQERGRSYIAIGPDDVEAGDFVFWMLSSPSFPEIPWTPGSFLAGGKFFTGLVLRRGLRGTYRFVGDCCCYGWEGNWTQETVRVC